MTRAFFALALVIASFACSPAAAQQVWRCGSEGRIFSDKPCTDGQRYSATDSRNEEDIRAARELASRERKLADTLASERLARADVLPGSGLIGIGPTAAERERELKRAQRMSRQKLRRPSGLRTSSATQRVFRRTPD